MYPGYYTGADGRRQLHYEDHVYPHGHCHCPCAHQPMISNSWDWHNNAEGTPEKHESKKPAAKKLKAGGTKTVGIFKFWRLSLAKSSISGVNSIASSKSIIASILWTIMLVGCCTGFGYQTFHFLAIYNRRPSIVLTDIENDGEADFPAVTICNQNRIRKSVYCEYFKERCENIEESVTNVSESEILQIMLDALENNNETLHHSYGHNRSMIQSCMFSGMPSLDEEECRANVRYLYDPDYGNCYIIPAENRDKVTLQVGEADFWREENDLTILLTIDADEFMEVERDQGLILTVHPGDTYPDIHTDGHELVPGKAYSIGVQKTSIVYLPLPYKTNCTEFENLSWSKTRYMMTSRMCTVGCSQHYQYEKCGFVTRNLRLFYDKIPWDMSTVTEDQEKCAEEEEKASMDLCRSLCGIPCRIHRPISPERLDSDGNTFFESDESDAELTMREIRALNHSKWYGKNETYDKLNLLYIKVYIKNLEHRIFRHTPLYITMELFSYLGGYSGVWLGFSLLTVYELAEIMFATFKYFLFKRKKRIQQKKLSRSLVEMKKTSKPVDIRKRKRFEFR